jgi:ferredoxin
MRRVETLSYPVQIFVAGDAASALTICRAYCDAVGLCVTVTPTLYAYTGGDEAGVIVGLINYGRFPSEPQAIFARARELARKLIDGLGQESATIQAPDKTLWISFRVDGK